MTAESLSQGNGDDATTLTPLQQAAVERIRFFQDALKKKGLYVRLSYEQEFLLEDDNKRPSLILPRDDMPLSDASDGKDRSYADMASYLRSKGLPYLQNIMTESTSGTEFLRAYEVTFDDPWPYLKNAPPMSATPLDIAGNLHQFRSHTLKEILLCGSCLDKSWSKPYHLVLRGRPYPEHPDRKHETLGMHANISVYNREGKNLFDHSEFERLCAERLLSLQQQAGLGFLAGEMGLDRIGVNEWTPYAIDIQSTKSENRSLQIRDSDEGNKSTNVHDKPHYYENRMMPADADPFVVTVLELAAIYDTAQKHLNGVAHYTSPMNFMRALPRNKGKSFMEKNLEPWVQRFNESTELRALLDDTLYDGILQEYGKNSSSAYKQNRTL